MVLLLAAVSFFSIARAEPTTSVLLMNHRTQALAALSLSGGVGLLAAAVLVAEYPKLYSVLLGRAIGEIFGFGVRMASLRRDLGARGSSWLSGGGWGAPGVGVVSWWGGAAPGGLRMSGGKTGAGVRAVARRGRALITYPPGAIARAMM